MNKVFPKLYKLTSKEEIQIWSIRTEGNIIITEHGLQNGKKQINKEVIKQGKNIGRSNETTAIEQAELEAKSRWEKKKKRRYVETIEGAKAKETDALIEGGIEVMLAHTFSKQGHKIKYPCFVSRKMDGIRCIAIVKNGKCTLWSRQRKQFISVPHIAKELESLYGNFNITLDGELFSEKYMDNFEHIVHLVKQQKKPDPQHTDVEYYIFDVVCSNFYENRIGLIKTGKYIKLVKQLIVNNEKELFNKFKQFRKEKFEGLMVRNTDCPYEYKRSYNLQKIKEFDDAEFKVQGIVEGRGKLASHAGALSCITKEGTEFEVKMSGDTEKLKDYFNNPKLVIGKLLTVRYQGLTTKNNVPRFPIGISIRDYE